MSKLVLPAVQEEAKEESSSVDDHSDEESIDYIDMLLQTNGQKHIE